MTFGSEVARGHWWFDDIALLNQSHDAFETLALNTDHAESLDFRIGTLFVIPGVVPRAPGHRPAVDA